MKKIIHIVLGKANPNRMNGVNKVAHNLATSQVEMGYEVNIFGLTNTKETDKIERKYQIKFYKRNKYYLDSDLKSDILKLNPQETIFHIHGGFIIDFYFISQLLKNNQYRYIFTSHGSYNKIAFYKNWFIKKIFFTIFDRQILKNAWKVQFLGQSEYDYIDTLITGINKVLIPNGQNLEELKFNFKKIDSNKRPIFGFVGRLDSYTKGLDILFDGFLQYKKQNGEGILWIIGDGPDMKKLKKFVENHNLEQDIVFFGSKFGEEKLNLIANMDVFVHTSRNEGFPMSVLEAAGLRKPLLVSKGTNFGEYVKKYRSGLLLNENNVINIVQALFQFENIYLNKIIKEQNKNTILMINDAFSWKTITKELINE